MIEIWLAMNYYSQFVKNEYSIQITCYVYQWPEIKIRQIYAGKGKINEP